MNHPSLTPWLYSSPSRELTPTAHDAIIESINDALPDLLWIGPSTPKQEHWMESHFKKIDARSFSESELHSISTLV